MSRVVDCGACHDLTKPASAEAINAKCLDCHDDDEERFGGMLASWKKEADELFYQSDAKATPEDHKLLEQLRKAGPLHNFEATRAILRQLANPAASSQQVAPRL